MNNESFPQEAKDLSSTENLNSPELTQQIGQTALDDVELDIPDNIVLGEK